MRINAFVYCKFSELHLTADLHLSKHLGFMKFSSMLPIILPSMNQIYCYSLLQLMLFNVRAQLKKKKKNL